MTSLLWEAAVILEYAVTALSSGFNAASLLARRWGSWRLRVGAWTLALMSLGVAAQGLAVALATLAGQGTASAPRAWLLAGSPGLAGSLLVTFLVVRSRRRSGRR